MSSPDSNVSATWEVRQGDCVERMREMPAASIDAVVCDPPYGLEFMGKEWDRLDGSNGFRRAANTADVGRNDVFGRSSARAPEYIAGSRMQLWHQAWATEALRVLKPGGHLLAFGGTRTYHRLAAGLEDAGFEIRDCIAWMYGSGFPKSLDVSKAIDKAAGAARTEVVGVRPGHEDFVDRTDAHSAGARREGWDRPWKDDPAKVRAHHLQMAPATSEAKRWDGWGTALKPAFEPIVVARKPLSGTVASNVLAHGTGALNIDGCRTPGTKPVMVRTETVVAAKSMSGESTGATSTGEMTSEGRWPANVVLDDEAAAVLDEQTGELASGKEAEGGHRRNGDKFRNAYGEFAGTEHEVGVLYGDRGGASRFFYCAKPTAAERQSYNLHPTVKPVEVMRWLLRLVTQPGGLVLDPFTGSGTTGIAAMREGFSFIGFEREAEYAQIARDRIRDDAPLLNIPREMAA